MSTAVVLSGGGSLGAVQVGMLRALAEAGIVPDVVVGTSVGALNGAFVAGCPWPTGLDDLTQVWCSLRRAAVLPATPLGVLRAAAGCSNHVVSDRGLRRLLDRHLTYGRLQDAAVPIVVVATEVATGREIVLRDAPAADAVLASASLPGVLPPVTIDGHALIDGGLVDNIPISVAADLGVDSIIVLPTGYACALLAPRRARDGAARRHPRCTAAAHRRRPEHAAEARPAGRPAAVPAVGVAGRLRPGTAAHRPRPQADRRLARPAEATGPGSRARAARPRTGDRPAKTTHDPHRPTRTGTAPDPTEGAP